MLTISPRSNFSAPAEAADDAAASDADDADVRALLGSSLGALERRGRFRCVSSAALGVSSPAGIATNRPELLKTRNQLHATRGRVESYRMKLGDSPLDSSASLLQLSVSAAS